MTTALPAAPDTFTDIPSGTKQGTVIGGRTHRQFINDHGDAIEAMIAMLGTGASNSSPTAGKVRRATGTGTAEWGQVQSVDMAANSVGATAIIDGSITTAEIATGGQLAKRQLDFTLASDISGTSLTSNTWIALNANQTFTVDDANSVVAISVSGHVSVGNVVASNGASVVIDSAGANTRYIVGGSFNSASGDTSNVLAGAGTIWITGLSAGSHTVRVELRSNGATSSASCRPATIPTESLRMQVLELKR